jgi:hypothetical protein
VRDTNGLGPSVITRSEIESHVGAIPPGASWVVSEETAAMREDIAAYARKVFDAIVEASFGRDISADFTVDLGAGRTLEVTCKVRR